jgi:hypothetical protein
MGDSKRFRVALFGRFCEGKCEPGFIQTQKDKLREEAKKRDYEIVGEFWEEGVAEDVPLDEREEMQRLMRLVWEEELIIDGVFLAELSGLGWNSRREHVTFTTFFELNDLSIITYEQTYRPDDWAVACSF